MSLKACRSGELQAPQPPRIPNATSSMLKSLFKPKPLTPLSAPWLTQHAAASSLTEFENSAKRENAVTIYHVTSFERAQSVFEQRQIFGVDVVSSAHFHWSVCGATNQARAHGAVLGFVWRGPVQRLILDRDSSTHSDRRPNILFDVPVATYDQQTWELRLYPGTTGVELSFIEMGSEAFLLREPVLLRVVQGG